MGKFFGTDGVRGIANKDLTCGLAFKLGQAAAIVLTEEAKHRPKILIGKDTRISSDMLEAALVSGICSVGGDVYSLSVVPTPAVAYLVKKYDCDAGFMVSASHNSYEYNGIKIFNGEGYKLSDELEEKIEDLILGDRPVKHDGEIGRAFRSKNPIEDYSEHIAKIANGNFDNIKIAVDCANGSASATFGKLADKIGLKADFIGFSPDGININDKCGSTSLETLSKYVVANKLDFGIAFDGDADRMLAVDENGVVVDGDKLMAILATELKTEGKLKDDTLVCTTMSNLGLFEMAKKSGLNLKVADVGDRYVLQEMLKGGFCLGGEASGHIIYKNEATTGDGQLAAVLLLNIYAKKGVAFSQLAKIMEKYPQVMVNVKVSQKVKENYDKDQAVKAAIKSAEKALLGSGRIIVRASGTEALVRVMIEGKNQEEIAALAEMVADKIREMK